MTRQIFDPGEAYQFDRSHEYAVLSGTTTRVKAAHMRLCHSRMQLVQISPRESQEMVFEAHERAFRFFGGVCRRGIYDNMRTAVSTVFVGKKRDYNRRFQEMCTHYLVDPVACTPGAGWEKGQVERQVGDVRGRLFVPSPRGRSYAEIKLDPGDTEALTPISEFPAPQRRLLAEETCCCVDGMHSFSVFLTKLHSLRPSNSERVTATALRRYAERIGEVPEFLSP